MAKNIVKKKSTAAKAVKSPCDSKYMDCKRLTIGETEYYTRLTRKFINRKIYKPADPGKIYSYIPGTVLKIMAVQGKKVEAGEPFLILEAMKMRNIVTAPVSGKVKALHVKEGDVIPKNFLIAEIEAF